MRNRYAWVVLACCTLGAPLVTRAWTAGVDPEEFPWSNPSLSPDQRADLVIRRMTLAQKAQLVHGAGMPGITATAQVVECSDSDGGFVPGIPILGIPDLNLDDSSVGVTRSGAGKVCDRTALRGGGLSAFPQGSW